MTGSATVQTMPNPEALGLDRVLESALAAPFHVRRGTSAGWDPGAPLSWERWLSIPPMSKDELRAVPYLVRDFCLTGPEDVSEFWRSGGVTGRPVFYPRTATDVEASLDAFTRTLRAAGLTRDDVLMVSLPIGIHPAGQQLARAAERLGAGVVWAGAGNQTPAAEQARLVRELGVTAWAGMPSFGLTLAELARDADAPLDVGPVGLLITTAEDLSDAKRDRLEKLWGARVVDVFGMSELTLLGVECGAAPGFHMWADVAYCEVLDEDTLRPVPDGEPGVLCVTPLTTGSCTPFVRWLSGDIVTMSRGCTCPLAAHPLVRHTGRLQSFFKIRGVNVGHVELEDLLLRQDAVADFRVVARDSTELLVDVECREGSTDSSTAQQLADRIRDAFGVRPAVRVVPRGTIDRLVAGQLKAQRFVSEVS
jgi:phenylacetate-CoA ligase